MHGDRVATWSCTHFAACGPYKLYFANSASSCGNTIERRVKVHEGMKELQSDTSQCSKLTVNESESNLWELASPKEIDGRVKKLA